MVDVIHERPVLTDEASSDGLTDLLDDCDLAMQGEDLELIKAAYGETYEVSCEDVYFSCRALAKSRQLVGRKRIK